VEADSIVDLAIKLYNFEIGEMKKTKLLIKETTLSNDFTKYNNLGETDVYKS